MLRGVTARRTLSVGTGLLTLAVAAVPAEVAAAGVLELAVAFGADADHVGHDGAGDGFLLGVLLARDGPG